MRPGFFAFLAVTAFILITVLAAHPPGGHMAETPAPVSATATPATPSAPAAAGPTAAAPGPKFAASPAQAQVALADTGDSHLHAGSLTDGTTAAVRPVRLVAAAVSSDNGDVENGRRVFQKCQACHSLEPGKTLVGPSLAKLIGRHAGTLEGFDYSDAMKKAGIVWDTATLDAYLADPQNVVPGNRMPFPGLKSETDRHDVVAFLAAAAGGPLPPAKSSGKAPTAVGPSSGVADVTYTLRSGIAEGRMVFVGVGGAIDGKVNPTLTAAEGQTVQVTLINGEGAEHDITFPDQGVKSPRVIGKGASTTIVVPAGKPGDYTYFCSAPGHRLAGMEGKFTVTAKPAAPTVAQADISRDPTDLPPPIGDRKPTTVRVDLQTVEIEGRLAEGTTFDYWTFNGKVPGPFIRVRVGDMVDVHLKNDANSSMIHSVDFHAVTGPGGGAAAMQVDPGGEKFFRFKALYPGLYVYHCATPMVAEHIANGMYGLILVEPEGGLPKVDHEFYVMQGEIYTDGAFGQHGSQEFSVEKLLAERPEYFVFNGSVGALTKLHPMVMKKGETARIFFGDGGPNFTSAFHVIGTIFDKVYDFGGLISPPLRGIQTVPVPPGGAVVVAFKMPVPGRYIVVDHALARMERGLSGLIIVEGQPTPDIFDAPGGVAVGGGH
ncbi:MAG: copper-containing nitrite reductase [Stellaceae bacterium]